MATTIKPNTSKAKTRTREERTQTITDKIKLASDIGPLKMTLYGRNKVGKTQFAGSSDRNTLLIDCNEKGFETVRDRPNVKVYEMENFGEEADLYWWAKAGNHDIEVFVFDTISMMATLCMQHILGEEHTRDTSVDPAMPHKQHWGKVAQLMNNVIINWRNLPYHIIFLAQERRWILEDEDTEDEGNTIEVTPSLSKAPLQTLLSAVGTIGRIYVREAEVKGKKVMERRMLVGPHPIYIAGTRIKGVPRVIRNPTLGKLLDVREKFGEVPPGEATHGMEI